MEMPHISAIVVISCHWSITCKNTKTLPAITGAEGSPEASLVCRTLFLTVVVSAGHLEDTAEQTMHDGD